MSIFEKASKAKLRFLITKGVVTTEDLWDLKLEDLDKMAISLRKQVKESEEESFIKTTNSKSIVAAETELKFEIVKHIIDVKLAEKEARVLAAEKRAKRAKLIELIGKKELTNLESKSIEDLKKELAELD
jgi:hypothetical protein